MAAARRLCEKLGTGRVYLEFLLKIHGLVTERGRRMQFWGDIIIHYPELIAELPRDITALEWGYEFDHPFAEHCARFAESGVRFYVCPGASNWNSISGRTDNAIGNIMSAADNRACQRGDRAAEHELGGFRALGPAAGRVYGVFGRGNGCVELEDRFEHDPRRRPFPARVQ